MSDYNYELVAPAIASLEAEQIRKLLKAEKFGAWLASRISSTSEDDEEEPWVELDSMQANEMAGAAGDAEYQATQVLAELSEEEREDLWIQAYGDDDSMNELLDLMPI